MEHCKCIVVVSRGALGVWGALWETVISFTSKRDEDK